MDQFETSPQPITNQQPQMPEVSQPVVADELAVLEDRLQAAENWRLQLFTEDWDDWRLAGEDKVRQRNRVNCQEVDSQISELQAELDLARSRQLGQIALDES